MVREVAKSKNWNKITVLGIPADFEEKYLMSYNKKDAEKIHEIQV